MVKCNISRDVVFCMDFSFVMIDIDVVFSIILSWDMVILLKLMRDILVLNVVYLCYVYVVVLFRNKFDVIVLNCFNGRLC